MRTERLVDAALEASVVGSFTRVGYSVRRRLERWAPPARLDGRVAVVTGATSGLGLAYARGLARLGATTRLVARDEARARAVRDAIVAETHNPDVDYWLADVADPGSVLDLAREVRATFPRLDVLIHNAGAIAPERVVVDGVESTAAAQLRGPYLLTESLLDLLGAAAPGRVILVASGGLYTERFDLERIASLEGPFDGVRTYARVKRAQLVLASAWARRLDPGRVVVHALHPGWVDTPGLRRSLPAFYRTLRPLLRTPDQGADTGLWLSGAPEARATSGSFWFDRRVRSAYRLPRTRPRDPRGDEDRLVAWLEGMGRGAGAP